MFEFRTKFHWYVPEGAIDNDWLRWWLGAEQTCDKPLSEPMLIKLLDAIYEFLHTLKWMQGSAYLTVRWPRASKTVTEASGFSRQSFLLNHIYFLVQDWSISSALAMELLQSCTKPSIYWWFSARLQYLQCVSNGDTAVWHQAIDIICIEKCEISGVGQVKISWYAEPWNMHGHWNQSSPGLNMLISYISPQWKCFVYTQIY